MKPEVLLLDEPTSGLDEETTERIIQVLNHSSTSYMIISQNRGLLARTTRCIYRMANGKLEELRKFYYFWRSQTGGPVFHRSSEDFSPRGGFNQLPVLDSFGSY